jgi:hypothetical protein
MNKSSSVSVLWLTILSTYNWLAHSSKESYRLCEKDYEIEEEARAQQRVVEPMMSEWMNEWVSEE